MTISKRLLQLIFIVILLSITCLQSQQVFAQLSICSWNLKNFGKSKTNEQLTVIANIIKEYDIIALQEINTGPDGAQRIADLVSILNQKSGSKWYYNISDRTTSEIPNEKERYAYIWKKHKDIEAQKGYLDKEWATKIVREPFIKSFTFKGKQLVLINYHAVPKKKNPSQEIALFKQYPSRIKEPFIILGDFNLSAADNVWNPLIKMGYSLALKQQKTTLRQQCIQNQCLANDYDQFIVDTNTIKISSSGAIPFHQTIYKLDVQQARKLSDHLPVFITIEL